MVHGSRMLHRNNKPWNAVFDQRSNKYSKELCKINEQIDKPLHSDQAHHSLEAQPNEKLRPFLYGDKIEHVLHLPSLKDLYVYSQFLFFLILH